MTHAVVTGGCGFIGSHLVDLLIQNGIKTTVLDNFSTGRPQNLQHLRGEPLLAVHEVDLAGEAGDLKPYFKEADFVFHLAALADIVPSVENPTKYFRSNVTGTLRTLEACREVRSLKKFVYAASSSCYGIPDNYPTPEDAEIRPQYPYALTKRLGEELVLHWGKLYKLPVLSFRFFNVYGPRARTFGTYGAVFGVFLAQKLAGKPYSIVGDGSQTRDFTYVTDVVEAVYQGAVSPLAGEVLNIGSGQTYSINLLVDRLAEGRPADKVYIPKRPGEPDATFADIRKIQRLVGWEPRISFQDGVRKMLQNIDYWRNAPVWTPESIAKETKSWFEALS